MTDLKQIDTEKLIAELRERDYIVVQEAKESWNAQTPVHLWVNDAKGVERVLRKIDKEKIIRHLEARAPEFVVVSQQRVAIFETGFIGDGDRVIKISTQTIETLQKILPPEIEKLAQQYVEEVKKGGDGAWTNHHLHNLNRLLKDVSQEKAKRVEWNADDPRRPRVR